jgi:hypothetical protein
MPQVEPGRAASIVHLIGDKAGHRAKRAATPRKMRRANARNGANPKMRKSLAEIPEIQFKPENTALLRGWSCPGFVDIQGSL